MAIKKKKKGQLVIGDAIWIRSELKKIIQRSDDVVEEDQAKGKVRKK